MKHNILTIASITAGICILLSACSTTKKTYMSTPNTASTVTNTSTKKNSSKKSTAAHDDKREEKTPTVATKSNFDATAIGGEWTVYAIKGKRIHGETRPTLNFNLEDHRLYGNNGCNIINADFSVSQPDNITISNLISTMMLCPDAPYESAINEAINATNHFSISRRGQECYLELLNTQHKSMMTLRKHNMDFINGPWTITEIEGEQIDNPDVRMVIDIPEQSIHGHTGCNILNGELLIDPDKSNSIQFSNIGVTRMLCPDPISKIETAFLVALEKVEFAHKGKNNTIIFS
ncbi:MAG: META domain-containing protein, partial [Muribaculum sp.]|nr:META domain-containing protein [Muribaculum sp.]